MRFAAWSPEFMHALETQERLRKAVERAYVIRAGDDTHGRCILDRPSEIVAFVDVRPDGTFSLRVLSIMWGQVDDLGVLTTIELGRVGTVHEIVGRWVAGETEHLADHMPWE